MRLSCTILVAVISSANTVSGEMNLNHPQLPADTALWSEGGEVISKRALRSREDTYDEDELEGTGDDVEERVDLLQSLDTLRNGSKRRGPSTSCDERISLQPERSRTKNRWKPCFS
ncbi:hypothetical protein PF005_g7628 [Phytophthora fragariae]|uniref:RxLR effector protein n=1 Tax=Phytophthora fragariae TaxID=53985 RepID=A0A6A3S7M8_9STRA|nr:hypothetical protein PF003_g38338 [Phytophthora fragariae]KAE8941811.1 hypothetical protein PF009_g8413 [Phytophthora fragariae]KAE9084373.1 hypothetical protein PF007_g21543 [Phytophthora fragariae]KAE9110808.1 hypothetical protein PF006_g20355 [Phytophthora fragariae]KAE9122046.1 hypothetical protein PF010_g6883 [Phytophthora fragariae]